MVMSKTKQHGAHSPFSVAMVDACRAVFFVFSEGGAGGIREFPQSRCAGV